MKPRKEREIKDMVKKMRLLILACLAGGLTLLFLTIFTGGIGNWLREMGVNYELNLIIELVFSGGFILLGLLFSIIFKLDLGIWPCQKLKNP